MSDPDGAPRFVCRFDGMVFSDVEKAIAHVKQYPRGGEIVLENSLIPVCEVRGHQVFVTMAGQPYVSTVRRR